MNELLESDSGQGSVEASFAIPMLFLLMLMLIQPAIFLYDRMVMENAAAEGCRLLATDPGSTSACDAFIRHRLSAIPQHHCFHVHEGGCSWDIQLSGNDNADRVSVRIANELKPLPLFDAASTLLGMTNSNGNLELSVAVSSQTQPDWVGGIEAGRSPSDWPGAWFE